MPAQEDVSLAHFPVRSMDQLGIKTGMGMLNRLGTGDDAIHYSTLWNALTSGAGGYAAMAEATRAFLDTGRRSAEALIDTPVKLAPLPVGMPLAYHDRGLPAVSVILKWIERNVIDEERGNEAVFRIGPAKT